MRPCEDGRTGDLVRIEAEGSRQTQAAKCSHRQQSDAECRNNAQRKIQNICRSTNILFCYLLLGRMQYCQHVLCTEHTSGSIAGPCRTIVQY